MTVAVISLSAVVLKAQHLTPIFKAYTNPLTPQERQAIQSDLQLTGNFELVSILTPSIKKYMKETGSGTFIFEAGIHQWTIEFEEYDVRSNNYVSMMHTANGIVVDDRGEERGYRGKIQSIPGSYFEFTNDGNDFYLEAPQNASAPDPAPVISIKDLIAQDSSGH
jgi:hypothetical protein